MAWTVAFHPDFEAEFDGLSREVRKAIACKATLLEEFGPELGQPHVDTLVGSEHANMKELRCTADGGSGGSLLLSIRLGLRCFSSAATSPVAARSVSIAD